MQDSLLLSGSDTFLISLPFVFMMAACLLRLDTVLARSSRKGRRRPPARGIDRNGEPIFTDPDGRRSGPRRGGAKPGSRRPAAHPVAVEGVVIERAYAVSSRGRGANLSEAA